MLWTIQVFETSKGLYFTQNVLGIQVEKFEATSWIQKHKAVKRDTGRKKWGFVKQICKKALSHSFIYRKMSLSERFYFFFVLQASFVEQKMGKA